MCHDVIKVPNFFFESIFVLKNRALFSIEKKKNFSFLWTKKNKMTEKINNQTSAATTNVDPITPSFDHKFKLMMLGRACNLEYQS